MREFAGQDDQKAPGSRPGRLYTRRYRSIPFPATFAPSFSPLSLFLLDLRRADL